MLGFRERPFVNADVYERHMGLNTKNGQLALITMQARTCGKSKKTREKTRKRGQFVDVGSHSLQGILITDNDDDDDDDDDEDNNNNNQNN